ncbi:apicoplast ribosomal protein S14p/S29e precursor, putative [Plasmodium ovale curtisi]|uniref:Apicoplast ribosomal protein S14p/S29e, putative n=1 Tax=Plasmodium ovale curtisi TaxID=864141 RepID=A0A1A8WKT3_PLAOA|nr:apicoplast ribosomal protein S14p/S29e precursor, putative [Plasmodium ovale curtisi]
MVVRTSVNVYLVGRCEMLNFVHFLLVYLVLAHLGIFCIRDRYPSYLFLSSHIFFQKIKKGQNYLRKGSSLNLKKRLDPNDKYTVIKRHEAKVQRNLKRKYLIERYKEKRELLKKYISEASSPIEYVYWKYKLASLPRDSCPVRKSTRLLLIFWPMQTPSPRVDTENVFPRICQGELVAHAYSVKVPRLL